MFDVYMRHRLQASMKCSFKSKGKLGSLIFEHAGLYKSSIIKTSVHLAELVGDCAITHLHSSHELYRNTRRVVVMTLGIHSTLGMCHTSIDCESDQANTIFQWHLSGTSWLELP